MQKPFPNTVQTSRREFLWRFGGGLGGVALAHLLGRHGLLAEEGESRQVATSAGIRGVLRGGPHQLPGRSIHRNSEALECTGLSCIGECKAHALLRPRFSGELTAAIARNSFIGVARQELI